jgi:hypothetical protein
MFYKLHKKCSSVRFLSLSVCYCSRTRNRICHLNACCGINLNDSLLKMSIVKESEGRKSRKNNCWVPYEKKSNFQRLKFNFIYRFLLTSIKRERWGLTEGFTTFPLLTTMNDKQPSDCHVYIEKYGNISWILITIAAVKSQRATTILIFIAMKLKVKEIWLSCSISYCSLLFLYFFFPISFELSTFQAHMSSHMCVLQRSYRQFIQLLAINVGLFCTACGES